MTKPGSTELTAVDDSKRAAMSANFKVTKDQLMDIVDSYLKRKYVEDLDSIKAVIGNSTDAITGALQVDQKQGINASSLDMRTAVFGTHHKDPPTGDTFCSMVLAALDDFMLKLLICCAIFSIVVDMSFAAGDPEKLKTAWIEGFAILFAVAVVSLVSAWSDFKKEGQFLKQQLLEENSKTVSNKHSLLISYTLFK